MQSGGERGGEAESKHAAHEEEEERAVVKAKQTMRIKLRIKLDPRVGGCNCTDQHSVRQIGEFSLIDGGRLSAISLALATDSGASDP